jgi:opacity protein-like surface antigen
MRTISGKSFRPSVFLLAAFLWPAFFSLPATTEAEKIPQRRFFIGLAAGYFYPQQGTYREIYGKVIWPAELQLEWALGRKMSVFCASRYLGTSGHTVLLAEQRLEETYALRWRMATLRLGMNYRLGAARFSPFLGAGVNYSFYKEQWFDVPLATEGKKAGFFIQAGGRYRLHRHWHAQAQLEYSMIPAGSGAQGRVNLGGLSLFLGLQAGIF